MTRVLPSDEEYPELNRLQTMVIVLVNREISNLGGNARQTFVAGIQVGDDINLPELRAIKTVVLGAMEDQLGKVMSRQLRDVFGDFIDSLFVED